MSIQNALIFLRDVELDNGLRKSCYSCKTRNELLEMLEKQGRGFTYEECENAINMLLLKCQTYEQAERVRELHVWFLLFQD
jgi:hypothetical protein